MERPNSFTQALLSIWLCAAMTTVAAAQQAPAPSAPVDSVWRRVEQFWRFAQSGDVASYRMFYDEAFRGWPCGTPHPTTTATIADWVRDIRDQKVKFRYTLTREGAADLGDAVVVFYQTPMLFEYPDGHVENAGRVFKITQTWRWSGNTWRIIGGMCAGLSAPGN